MASMLTPNIFGNAVAGSIMYNILVIIGLLCVRNEESNR